MADQGTPSVWMVQPGGMNPENMVPERPITMLSAFPPAPTNPGTKVTSSEPIGASVIGPVAVTVPPSTARAPHWKDISPPESMVAVDSMVKSSPVLQLSEPTTICWFGMVLKVPRLSMVPAVVALS